MGRDKVPLYAQIREDHRRLGLGVRALARKYGVHRRMVREALASPVPAPRKVPVRESPVLGAVAGLIDGCCGRIWPRRASSGIPRGGSGSGCADEHDAAGVVFVCGQYVARGGPRSPRRTRAAAGSVEGFVPQAKEPGAEAEVDFGPVTDRAGRAADAVLHLFALPAVVFGQGLSTGCMPARRRKRSWKGT